MAIAITIAVALILSLAPAILSLFIYDSLGISSRSSSGSSSPAKRPAPSSPRDAPAQEASSPLRRVLPGAEFSAAPSSPRDAPARGARSAPQSGAAFFFVGTPHSNAEASTPLPNEHKSTKHTANYKHERTIYNNIYIYIYIYSQTAYTHMIKQQQTMPRQARRAPPRSGPTGQTPTPTGYYCYYE